MLAIVLSGGGAKGAYQAGVWKALKKLRIKYDIITGSSIGALNGMMMVQNKYNQCMKMWQNIDFDQLYEDFDEDNNMHLEYIDKILDGGIDTSKIEKIISKYYNVKKIYKSKIEFGVVAYNLSAKSVVYASKKNTDKEKLKKYILASITCFPVFKPAKIDSDLLIDGGYYDNLPINLAIEMGATEVIAVDLKAIGLKKTVKDKSVKITYLTPKNKLDSFLKFEKESTRKMIKLGYNDTMKLFGNYEGEYFTFKKDTISSIYDTYIDKILKLREEYDCNYGNLKEINKEVMLKIIEDAMNILKLKEEKIYNISTLNNELLKELDNIDDISINEIDVDNIKKIFKRKTIVKYFYTKFKNHDKINYTVFGFFPKELTTAIYLLALRS